MARVTSSVGDMGQASRASTYCATHWVLLPWVSLLQCPSGPFMSRRRLAAIWVSHKCCPPALNVVARAIPRLGGILRLPRASTCRVARQGCRLWLSDPPCPAGRFMSCRRVTKTLGAIPILTLLRCISWRGGTTTWVSVEPCPAPVRVVWPARDTASGCQTLHVQRAVMYKYKNRGMVGEQLCWVSDFH